MRQPPPWWPEGEPFPPRRWGRRYGQPPPFVRFIGCFVLVVLGVSLLTGALAGAAFHAGLGTRPFFAFPLVIVLGLIALAVFGGVRRVAAPMDNLIDAARRIESGDYSASVPETGSADIRSVAHAFNAMSARLKTIDEQRRSFLADVTHELRTPLSVIRGQAEAIADGVYPADEAHLGPILDATQTLDRLVEDLRTLVLTDAGNLVLHRESTDLGALVHDAVESFRAQAEAARVELSAETRGDGAPILVDPSRMRQLIGNLLSNALRHTPAGGTVTVSLADGSQVTVSDTGEGISPELLPHVFERFAKGPKSTGSGLGLAIAHDIVVAHGGTITIENGTPRGTVVRIRLPR
jgi:signal transduction histidine kinase